MLGFDLPKMPDELEQRFAMCDGANTSDETNSSRQVMTALNIFEGLCQEVNGVCTCQIRR
jgi:hypothetical protein